MVWCRTRLYLLYRIINAILYLNFSLAIRFLLYVPFPTKVARIEPKSLAQNEPKRIGPQTKSGTDQTEMPGTITPKWVAQNEPKYPTG